jgi:hypothetical protein
MYQRTKATHLRAVIRQDQTQNLQIAAIIMKLKAKPSFKFLNPITDAIATIVY